jgi:purine-nucleoside phosphorylase
MSFTYGMYRESAEYLQRRFSRARPETALVLGSGLGFLGDLAEDALIVPLPKFPISPPRPTRARRAARMRRAFGGAGFADEGGAYLYEGYSMAQVYLIGSCAFGGKNLIVTNARAAGPWLRPRQSC